MIAILGYRGATSIVAIVLLTATIMAVSARISAAGEARAAGPMPVGSTQLLENSKRYDERLIVYEGEVVGDVMIRGSHAWINVNDDPYSRQGSGFRLSGYNRGQGLLINLADAKKIKNVGNYGRRGDIVRVIGTFKRSSADHGGQMMINALSGGKLTVVKRGFRLPTPISTQKIGLAVLSMLSACLIFAAYRFRAVTRRRKS